MYRLLVRDVLRGVCGGDGVGVGVGGGGGGVGGELGGNIQKFPDAKARVFLPYNKALGTTAPAPRATLLSQTRGAPGARAAPGIAPDQAGPSGFVPAKPGIGRWDERSRGQECIRWCALGD